MDDETRAAATFALAQLGPLADSDDAFAAPLASSVVRVKATVFSRSALRNDVFVLRLLVAHDAAHQAPSDFAHFEAYAVWKRHAAANAAALVKDAHLNHKDALVSVTVKTAENLRPKDKNGANNAYAVVAYPDGSSRNVLAVFQSEPVPNSLNPEWNLKVSLVIRDSKDPLTISLWNKPSASSINSKPSFPFLKPATNQSTPPPSASLPPDAFLGLITLPGSTLLQLLPGDPSSSDSLDRWFTLDKRSKKSRVSGRVLISLHRHTNLQGMSAEHVFGDVMQCIPARPRDAFRGVLRRLVDAEARDSQPGRSRRGVVLSDQSAEMVDVVARYWGLDACARAIIELEVYKEVHDAGFINTACLFGIYTQRVQHIEEAHQQSRISIDELARFERLGLSLHTLLHTQLSTFFDQPLDAFTSSSATIFATLVSTLDSLTHHPLLSTPIDKRNPSLRDTMLTLEGYISESLAIRYHAFAKLDGEEEGARKVGVGEGVDPLVLISGRVVSELQVFLEVFDALILGKFHIPSMAATKYVDNLSPHMDAYVAAMVSSGASGPVPLNVAFTVYRSMQDLLELCEKIDFRLVEKVKLREWFKPFLEEFVKLSESKINEWVQNAVAVDDFSLLPAGHSSSVLDIFMSFQQQLEFIINLNWPSDEETALFIGKLIE
ncbi:hypothetical protein HDU98_012152, partial [Podochytrium sp. JEL0797]